MWGRSWSLISLLASCHIVWLLTTWCTKPEKQISLRLGKKINKINKKPPKLSNREVVRGCKDPPVLWTVFMFVLLLGMIVMSRCDSS